MTIRLMHTILRIAFRDVVLFALGVATGAVWHALLG